MCAHTEPETHSQSPHTSKSSLSVNECASQLYVLLYHSFYFWCPDLNIHFLYFLFTHSFFLVTGVLTESFIDWDQLKVSLCTWCGSFAEVWVNYSCWRSVTPSHSDLWVSVCICTSFYFNCSLWLFLFHLLTHLNITTPCKVSHQTFINLSCIQHCAYYKDCAYLFSTWSRLLCIACLIRFFPEFFMFNLLDFSLLFVQ